jgi:hypothetical protein
MADSNPDYRPEDLKRYAATLIQYAPSIILWNILLGAVPGFVIVGTLGMTLFRNSAYYDSPNYAAGMITGLLGAVAGGFIGSWVGEWRAMQLRLQAQTALAALQTELNTRTQPTTVLSPIPEPEISAPTPDYGKPAKIATVAMSRFSGSVLPERTLTSETVDGGTFGIKLKGTVLEIYGRNTDSSWLLIETNPALWVKAKDIAAEGNLADLPVVG